MSCDTVKTETFGIAGTDVAEFVEALLSAVQSPDSPAIADKKTIIHSLVQSLSLLQYICRRFSVKWATIQKQKSNTARNLAKAVRFVSEVEITERKKEEKPGYCGTTKLAVTR